MRVEEILKLKQEELGKKISMLPKVTGVKGQYYIYSNDTKPKPMLCVHIDTINTSMNCEDDLVIHKEGRVLSVDRSCSAFCLGGDDRAGVWIALELIKYMEETQDFKYDIGFFYDEEIGCVGSSKYTVSEHTTALIGLDRRSPKGTNEVATYGCDNKALIVKFMEQGYSEASGSVTDASNLAESCNIACINLSVGYDFEHTKDELLYLDCMIFTKHILIGMDWDDTVYDYVPFSYGAWDNSKHLFLNDGAYSTMLEEFIEELGYSIDSVLAWDEDRRLCGRY